MLRTTPTSIYDYDGPEKMKEAYPELEFTGPGVYIFQDGTYIIIVAMPPAGHPLKPFPWKATRHWSARTTWRVSYFNEPYQDSILANRPPTQMDNHELPAEMSIPAEEDDLPMRTSPGQGVPLSKPHPTANEMQALTEALLKVAEGLTTLKQPYPQSRGPQ